MKNYIMAFVVIVTLMSCKQPFYPIVEPRYKNVLVVEGFLNIGGKTTIRLSRSLDLKDYQTRVSEANAIVEVLGSDGSTITAEHTSSGDYALSTQNLSLGTSYKLRISTSNGRVYETDYLENIETAEIGNLEYGIEERGLTIYLSTFGRLDQAKFYNWNFTETWEIRSSIPSDWELKNFRIVRRDPDVNIERCWNDEASYRILLGSTERLSENKLSRIPLTFVNGNSIKLSQMYSILVRQNGLTQAGYQYLEMMKKNTEQIGTLFDAQPSELRGNIFCITDPTEPVIGWIGSGNVTEKRIFISNKVRPSEWAYRESCEIRNIHADSILIMLQRNFLIYRREEFVAMPPPPPPFKPGDTVYLIAPRDCIDCRFRGYNVKPSYWPN